jgi:hypothetical protein
MLSILASSDEESHSASNLLMHFGDHTNIRDRVSKLAVYGELLGAAKRAIQAIVDGGLPHDNLICFCEGVAEGRPCDNDGTTPNVVANPHIIRHKGRPQGILGKRCKPGMSNQTNKILMHSETSATSREVEGVPLLNLAWEEQNLTRQHIQVESPNLPLGNLNHNFVEPMSSQAASNNDETHQLGLSKPPLQPIQARNKPATRCGACGDVGHRSTDTLCPKFGFHASLVTRELFKIV